MSLSISPRRTRSAGKITGDGETPRGTAGDQLGEVSFVSGRAMEKESKRRRKFHEALMKIYFPPPPALPDQMSETEDNELTEDVPERLDATFSLEPDYAETACCFSDGIDDHAPEKLTRAQRKRIRKRKLKEGASSRRKLIGPLLPFEYELPGMKKPTNDAVVDASETNDGRPRY